MLFLLSEQCGRPNKMGLWEKIDVDKNETLQLKGIALIIMFCHHLFGCGTFLMLEENKWIPCFGVYDSIFSNGFKICIGVFAAISGYGLYKSYIVIR